MYIKNFKELNVWKKSKSITISIYKIFIDIKDYSFRNQIQRASISIMNNIAEGFGRESNNELIRFLRISKGSCYEVISMIDISLELSYINKENKKELEEELEIIAKMLNKFIRYLKTNKTNSTNKTV